MDEQNNNNQPQDKINKLEQSVELLTKLVTQLAQNKEEKSEPKVENKEERDPYKEALNKEEELKKIKEEAKKEIIFADKVNNFGSRYSHLKEEDINMILSSCKNEDNNFIAMKYLDLSFQDDNIKNGMPLKLKNKIAKFNSFNQKEKIEHVKEYFEVLDEVIEIQNNMEAVRHSLQNKNSVSNKQKIGIDLMQLATDKYSKQKIEKVG
jgi:hypothetical protein